MSVASRTKTSSARYRRSGSLPETGRDGRFGTKEAPAVHLLETLVILDYTGPPSSRRRLRVARRELIGAAGDLERAGLVVLRETGTDGGVWVSLSGAGHRLLAARPGRLAPRETA